MVASAAQIAYLWQTVVTNILSVNCRMLLPLATKYVVSSGRESPISYNQWVSEDILQVALVSLIVFISLLPLRYILP